MAISATMVRELREMTGAAMMDCKKALEAAGGDIQEAVDQLRKQGLKSAAKKASRETAEGRVIAVSSEAGKRGHLIGIACETDFLAATDPFKAFVAELEEHVATCDPTAIEDGERPILKQPWKGEGMSVAEKLQEAVGQFGENLRFTDLVRLESPGGTVGFYIHHDNKRGAIASITHSAVGDKVQEVLRGLCQHIVVFSPSFRTKAEVSPEELERERGVLRESDEVKSKPEEIREKIVEGKLSKFFAGVVLEEQPWIHDDKHSVKKAIEKELGKDSSIEAFGRIQLGA